MSLRPAIPRQVALPQSLPPLHRLESMIRWRVPARNNKSANGKCRISGLSQQRAQRTKSPSSLFTTFDRRRAHHASAQKARAAQCNMNPVPPTANGAPAADVACQMLLLTPLGVVLGSGAVGVSWRGERLRAAPSRNSRKQKGDGPRRVPGPLKYIYYSPASVCKQKGTFYLLLEVLSSFCPPSRREPPAKSLASGSFQMATDVRS
jgi:hypothetical protein